MNKYVEKRKAEESKPFLPKPFELTMRISENHPVSRVRPLYDGKAESNYYGRLLTWKVTGKSTYHLQKNIQMIVDFLNDEWKLSRENVIIGSSVHNKKGGFCFSIWTKDWKLTFDLKRGEIEKDFFLQEVEKITNKFSEEKVQNTANLNAEKMQKSYRVEEEEFEDGEFRGADEIEENIKISEGARKKVDVNVYERSKKARRICIKKYGLDCYVCGFNFNDFYGEEVSKNYIHVHHLKPLSEIGEEYEVNPSKDLRPVCPNCHAMIHRKEDGFYSIEEVKGFIEKQKKDLKNSIRE
jgi:predicted HNH restriction endonuclease